MFWYFRTQWRTASNPRFCPSLVVCVGEWAVAKGVKIPSCSKINPLFHGLTFTGAWSVGVCEGVALCARTCESYVGVYVRTRKAPLMSPGTVVPVSSADQGQKEILGFSTFGYVCTLRCFPCLHWNEWRRSQCVWFVCNWEGKSVFRAVF